MSDNTSLKQRFLLYLKIFFYTFQLSATTFGGGYVIVSLVQRLFVEKLHWLEEEEMLNDAAIAQSAPGSVAVNISVIVGKRLAGWGGVLCALIGTAAPPLIILSILSVSYSVFIQSTLVRYLLQGMQAAVIALIINTTLTLCLPYWKKRDFLALGLTALACLLSFFVSVVYIICGGAVLGAVFARVSLQRRKRSE